MAKKLERLTAALLKNPADLKEGRNSDGGNLYLVKKSPSPGDPLRKSVTFYWTFLYRWGGKQIEAAIGPLHSVSRKDARARAMEGRRMLHESPPRSPARVWRDARRANQQPRADAFAQVWQDYVAANHADWSAKHRAEWTRSFAICKPLHDRACAEIVTVDVHAVLEFDLAKGARDRESHVRADRGGARPGQGARPHPRKHGESSALEEPHGSAVLQGQQTAQSCARRRWRDRHDPARQLRRFALCQRERLRRPSAL